MTDEQRKYLEENAPRPWIFDGGIVRDARSLKVWDVGDGNDDEEVAKIVISLINES